MTSVPIYWSDIWTQVPLCTRTSPSTMLTDTQLTYSDGSPQWWANLLGQFLSYLRQSHNGEWLIVEHEISEISICNQVYVSNLLESRVWRLLTDNSLRELGPNCLLLCNRIWRSEKSCSLPWSSTLWNLASTAQAAASSCIRITASLVLTSVLAITTWSGLWKEVFASTVPLNILVKLSLRSQTFLLSDELLVIQRSEMMVVKLLSTNLIKSLFLSMQICCSDLVQWQLSPWRCSDYVAKKGRRMSLFDLNIIAFSHVYLMSLSWLQKQWRNGLWQDSKDWLKLVSLDGNT